MCIIEQSGDNLKLHLDHDSDFADFIPFLVDYVTLWKVSKYGVISGAITGKYGPEITLYSDTFHAVCISGM